MGKGYWRCRKHKEKCESYVTGIVKNLNNGERQDDCMHLVEFVKPNGEVRKVECKSCGAEMYECWDTRAKEYTGYLWGCKCTSPNLRLSIG